MKKVNIVLKSIVDVKEFVNLVSKCDFDVDIRSGRYLVDAKSIMGIFSLDLANELTLEVHTDGGEKFLADIEKFKA